MKAATRVKACNRVVWIQMEAVQVFAASQGRRTLEIAPASHATECFAKVEPMNPFGNNVVKKGEST